MFYEQRTTVPESPARLRAEYDADLAAIVEERGVGAAAERTGIDRDRLAALASGEAPDLSLAEAAEIAALAPDEPDPETIVDLACEHLLLGMTTAVLDVEAVASDLAIDLDPKEIQQKVERRAPMTFGEFVHVQYVIADGAP